MIINPFRCDNCIEELQPEDIGVTLKEGELVRVCLFCGNTIKLKKEGVE